MTMETSRRILIVEDHEMFAQALRWRLEANGHEATVLIPVHDSQVLPHVDELGPDLVLLDLNLAPGVSPGETFIPPLLERHRPVVVLTACTDDLRLARVIDQGVPVLSKAATVDHMIGTVTDALAGRTLHSWPEEGHIRANAMLARRQRRNELAVFEALTRREREVLSGLQNGMSVDAIAEKQFVSVATIRSHIRGIFSKLNVHNQLAAVHKAHAAGWAGGRR